MTDDKLPATIPIPERARNGRPSDRFTIKPPNNFMSPSEWERIRKNGNMAAERMATILGHPQFHKLPIRDQLLAIKIAMDTHMKPTVVEDKTITINQYSTTEGNALRALSEKAVLPEMIKSAERKRTN